MRTLELPSDLVEQIEVFRQRRGPYWAKELAKLLQQELNLTEWDEEVRRPGPDAERLSDQDAERLAVQAVREARRERKP